MTNICGFLGCFDSNWCYLPVKCIGKWNRFLVLCSKMKCNITLFSSAVRVSTVNHTFCSVRWGMSLSFRVYEIIIYIQTMYLYIHICVCGEINETYSSDWNASISYYENIYKNIRIQQNQNIPITILKWKMLNITNHKFPNSRIAKWWVLYHVVNQ